MTEFLLATGIIALAGLGLGLGLVLGRGPARTSCGASSALARGRCEDCPLRRAAAREGAAR